MALENSRCLAASEEPHMPGRWPCWSTLRANGAIGLAGSVCADDGRHKDRGGDLGDVPKKGQLISSWRRRSPSTALLHVAG